LRAGFESRSSRRGGILASEMAYGVVRQGFDPGCRFSFVSSRECSDPLLSTIDCTCVTLYWVSELSQRRATFIYLFNPVYRPRRATCAGGMVIVSECLS
jgi:hypothetical protein